MTSASKIEPFNLCKNSVPFSKAKVLRFEPIEAPAASPSWIAHQPSVASRLRACRSRNQKPSVNQLEALHSISSLAVTARMKLSCVTPLWSRIPKETQCGPKYLTKPVLAYIAFCRAVISEYPQKVFGLALICSKSRKGNSSWLLLPPITEMIPSTSGSANASCKSASLDFIVVEPNLSLSLTCSPKVTSNPSALSRCVDSCDTDFPSSPLSMRASEPDGAITERRPPLARGSGNLLMPWILIHGIV